MIGQTIAHYQILEKVGEGGMGVVFRARDTRLEREVALKFLSLDFTGSEELKERFIQEAKAASVLDHPNICTIHSIDETDDGRLFIAMGYYQGETVKAKLRRGPLPWPEAVDLAVQIAAGLQAAHERGIIHMDVKPANLMVTPEGTVKILDFGLSRFTSEIDRTRPQGPLMGTVAYMPPEQVQGEETGPASDVWGLGVVLYELVTGTRPFQGRTDMAVLYSIVHRDFEPPIDKVPDLPVELDRIIRRALFKDRRHRYRDLGEVLADLEPLHASQAAARDLPWVSHRDWRRQKLLQRFTGVVAAVALVLLFVFLGTKGEEGKDPTLPDPTKIVLRDLQDLSEIPDSSWLGTALTELIVFELPGGEGLRWTRDGAEGAGGGELADLDAEWVVEGSFRVFEAEAGQRLEADLRLLTVPSGDVALELDAERPVGELPELAAEQAESLAPLVGARTRERFEEAAVEPESSEAASLLAAAQQALRVLEAKKALEALRRALELEPDQPQLLLTRAEALKELRYESKARQAIAAACEAARRWPRRERIRCLAWQLEIGGQLNPAAALLRLLWLVGDRPKSSEDLSRIDRGLHLAYVLALARQRAAADGILDAVAPLAPEDPRVALTRAEAARGEDRLAQQEAAGRAARLAQQVGAPLVLARALVLEGEAHRWQGELEQATEKLRAAREIYVRAGYEWGEAAALMFLGNVQWEQRDLRGSRASWERALRLYSDIGSARRSRALHNLALLYDERGDYLAAIKIYREQAKVFEENGSRDGAVMSLCNLALVLAQTGDYAGAEGASEMAFRVLETWKNQSFEGLALWRLGQIRLQQGKLADARQKLTEALEKLGDSGDQLDRARTSVSLARVLYLQGELGDALELQEKAFPVFLENGNEKLYTSLRTQIGDTLTSQGRLEEARQAFEEALAIQRNTLVDPHPAAQTRLSLASLLNVEGHYREAAAQAEMVVAELARSGAKTLRVEAHTVLARSLCARGEIDQAAAQIDRAKALLGDIESPLYRLPLEITEARLLAARGEGTQALDRLQEPLAEATTERLLGLELEIDLALGEIWLTIGSGDSGRSRLSELVETARAKGFGAISEMARRAASKAEQTLGAKR